MPADDTIADAVRAALVKDGWTITLDPYSISYEEFNVRIDLAVERVFVAERGTDRIAVEIKSFVGRSPVNDFRDALGQYDLYRMILEDVDPGRKLYVAMSEETYATLFATRAVERLLAKRPIPLVIVRISSEEVVQWIG
jgi:hypothetical protein